MASASETRAKILASVYQNGPILPVKVSKNVGGSPLFVGAFLSELVSSGQILISKAKIGNSPLYYAKGQEEKLQVLREHLSQMRKKAFDLIKQFKIIRETDMDPAERVAMSEINDFAFPLIVEYEDKKERFWKWYLISDEEAKERINQILNPKKEIVEEKTEEKPPEPIKEKKLEEIQKTLPEENKIILCDFGNNIKKYIEEQGLNIEEVTPLRKNKEINFIITMPSPMGKLRYLLKAKSKKKVNEGDLSLAYAEGTAMNLPTIFLAEGELTLKGKKYLKEQLKGLVFRSID